MLNDDVYFAKSDENSKSYEDLKITISSVQFKPSLSN